MQENNAEHRLFVSYSSTDLAAVEAIEKELGEKGVSVWRDRNDLYAGEHWPKALGEAIAAKDAVLLVWSKHARESDYVELEWCTGIALKKTILPYRLDDTPLPPSLSAVHAIDARSAGSMEKVVQALRKHSVAADAPRAKEVINALGEIEGKDLEGVLETVKSIFEQNNWLVHGNVYQARYGPDT